LTLPGKSVGPLRCRVVGSMEWSDLTVRAKSPIGFFDSQNQLFYRSRGGEPLAPKKQAVISIQSL
jgi:hypothetical protein